MVRSLFWTFAKYFFRFLVTIFTWLKIMLTFLYHWMIAWSFSGDRLADMKIRCNRISFSQSSKVVLELGEWDHEGRFYTISVSESLHSQFTNSWFTNFCHNTIDSLMCTPLIYGAVFHWNIEHIILCAQKYIVLKYPECTLPSSLDLYHFTYFV